MLPCFLHQTSAGLPPPPPFPPMLLWSLFLRLKDGQFSHLLTNRDGYAIERCSVAFVPPVNHRDPFPPSRTVPRGIPTRLWVSLVPLLWSLITGVGFLFLFIGWKRLSSLDLGVKSFCHSFLGLESGMMFLWFFPVPSASFSLLSAWFVIVSRSQCLTILLLMCLVLVG